MITASKTHPSCTRDLTGFLQYLTDHCRFQSFRPEDGALVDSYSRESIFFDLSFSNFWAWDEVFHYRWRIIGDALAIVYITLDQEPAAILMPGPSRDLSLAAAELRRIFAAQGCPLQVEYVPEAWLPLYRGLGCPVKIFTDRNWSDYVYDVADFADLEGGENKGKRRELRSIAALAAEFRPLTEHNFGDALEVFRKWCAWHACRECYYGCEQQTFAHLRDIWHLRDFYGGVVYLDGAPAAFALGETLGECACYSFQKNVENLRGLTYFLSYHCTQLPGHPPRLNWCEDMGLEGLRINKLRYRPSEIVSKYAVKIEG